MQVFRKLGDVPTDFGPTVVSVGNFDGVHHAHQSVLKEVVTRAKALNAKAVALTFDPHPTRILRPESSPKLITPLARKLQFLKETGIDATLVLPFNRDFSVTTPSDFARNILAGTLKAKEVHEGENFHFGHKAEGNTDRLAEFGRELGFTVKTYREMKLRNQTVSSSNIRLLIAEGDVSRARTLLGRVFSIVGTPGRGRGYGHKYTVPTINLARYDELVPANGVYVTRTRVGEKIFDSVTNVGNRPTFGEDSFAIETHLLNFHPIDVLADTEVEICFLKWLRPEIKWPDVEALRKQIAIDVHRARRFFYLWSVAR
jgi:riboflavin kinase/FMN adenylyltransferase